MEYLDFDVEIGAGNGLEYPVAARSPAGEACEVMRFPYNRDRMEMRLKDLTIALLQSASIARLVLPPELQSVQEMGTDFFNALFTGDIRTRYDLSQRMAQEQGKGLRVRLHIQPGEVSALPWEYLYDPRLHEYLCLSAGTPLVRYPDVPQAIRPIAVELPLRILGMLCSPSDLPALDIDQEKKRVEDALADLCKRGLVELAWLPGETWSDLQDALLAGPWHVFHFIGHGDFDAQRDEGFLALTGANGKAHKLHATELARLLADHRELRVVVLNACKGAHASWESVYSSTAAVLVRRGIACAIAMQFAITDKAALELSRRFYAMLARGLPVDAALAEARKSLSIAFANSVEWGTPVLFMRSPDGLLFKMGDAKEKKAAAPRKTGAREKPAPPAPVVNINTGGGAYIAGNVETGGGDFTGRDQVSEQTRAQASEPAPEQVRKPEEPKPVQKAPAVLRPRQLFEPEMVEVPEGEFWMGSGDEDKNTRDAEKPRHKVWLDAYQIGRYPVTAAQFSEFVEKSRCRTTAEERGGNHTWRTPRGKGSDLSGRDDHPVTCVSWEDAQVYCRWLSEATGRRYALPSEAQWEKAARGTDGQIYAWGDTVSTKENRLCNAGRWYGGTTPVGQFSPAGDSPYGCADMCGNVWEWCADWYSEVYYRDSPARNPAGPADGEMRVLRGGSWNSLRWYARCADRLRYVPDFFSDVVGFRLVSPGIFLGSAS
jgi:formylglycine-generating enzyme required for sulfatase activity